jgi:hypothetical protein
MKEIAVNLQNNSHLAYLMVAEMVLGVDLKLLMNEYNISIDEITANYNTGKGTKVSKTTIQRYKNVTLRDVNGGQCYPKGIPAKFMLWLYDYIIEKNNITF